MITAKPFYRPPSEDLRYLPEGPRVLRHLSGRHPQLGWVSIQHAADNPTGSLNVLDLVTRENVRHDLPGRPGFFAETEQPGVLLVGLERRLVFYDLASKALTETGVEVSRDERVIINEGLAVEGGIVFGTKHLQFEQEIAALYFFDTSRRRLCTLRDRQICSNGKHLFQRAGQTLLADIDSPRKTVVVYEADLPGCTLEAQRPLLADFRNQPAFPDGLRPTPGGASLIIAFFNPGAAEFGIARQVAIDSGEIEAEWRLPGSPRVTCPEFVMLDGRVQLIFTTAVEGMPQQQRRQSPEAGSLFIADTGFDALPPPPPFVHGF